MREIRTRKRSKIRRNTTKKQDDRTIRIYKTKRTK